MGIALPQWIIEGKNNIWVLGFYGVLFGGVLPVIVVQLTTFHVAIHVVLMFVCIGSLVVR
jgi:preprotein translocase subunit Sec63